jgi:UDP-N-acetyl-alpha-D-muramoyl-L-alanyl-L-glutamate epimerase
MAPDDLFRYDEYIIDPARHSVSCRYATDEHVFTERFTFPPGGDWANEAVRAAARLLFLVAGVSYYKTTAAPVVDLGDLATTSLERSFLSEYYVNGLAEFAYRNDMDLGGLRVIGPDLVDPPAPDYTPRPGRPLIPFGGGIDSIVTVDALTLDHPDAALCVVHPPGDRFVALEDAARVTGMPVRHVERVIDPLVRQSAAMGFLNGHVPVTAIITATAVVAAILEGRDAVVLSNEWSASVPTLVSGGGAINHQWSKGAEFEQAFGEVVQASVGEHFSVFSYLRPRSELWVSAQFARLTPYHRAFRSCNRAFQQDPAQRLDHWCGHCDKCCFIDLILAPFMSRTDLAAVFDGAEPLDNPDNEERFRTLLALGTGVKPFECVGDSDESRAATLLAAQRPDRMDTVLLQRLRDEVAAQSPTPTTGTDADTGPEAGVGALLEPRGTHRIPDRYAPADLLVRAR